MDAYKRFAVIYDELINSDIDYIGWSSKILDSVKEFGVNNCDYLDLACGTGNMTALIAPNFRNAWGSDLSEEMLIEADDKLRRLKQKVNFVCQDMRELNLNREFDLITCCLDSLNYILNEKDLEKIFKNVEKHLKKDGLFIFDINSFYKLSEIIGDNTFIHNSEDVAYIWENSFEDSIANMYLTFFVRNGDVYERFEEEHEERAYTEETIERLLEKCNLKIANKMDNYSSDNVEKNIERIAYVVRKIN